MSVFAEIGRGDGGQAIWLIGLLLVLVCLGAAAYLAYLRNILGAVLLLVVAIVAAVLLL